MISGPGEVVEAGDRLYTLSRTGSSTEINYVLKSNMARVPVTTLAGDAFVLSFDGHYLYYLIGSTLIRLEPRGASRELDNGVTSYYADGKRSSCSQGSNCPQTHLVFIAKGSEVISYSNLDDTKSPAYTSPEATTVILGITTDGEKLFLYERRTTVCDPLCSYTHNLVRTARDGVAEPSDGPFYSTGDLIGRLAIAEGFVYWREYSTPTTGSLKRLGTSADPLSLNLNINNVLVTQGVQHLNNNVPLIERRPTFVRAFAQSNGAAAQGVTAFLYGYWSGVDVAGPLLPVNPVGTKLNITGSYLQDDINQAFLFELPWDWTTKDDLRLHVELNPYRLPLETNYNDNSFTVGPFDFKPSGRLEVQFVSFGFMLNNQTYYPSLLGDVIGNYSWIRRVYPLSSTPGFINDSSPGFRPNNWFVFDAGLAARVNRTSPECSLPPFLIRDNQGNITKDYRNLCASAYTNAQMAALRQENNLSQDLFMYGMIRDLGGDLFPRGQAGSNRISSGPAAPGFVSVILYAQHEIGHTLGRGHPLAGNGQCDLEGSDPSPAYPNARVGPQSGIVEAFDAGDPALGLPRRVLPGWNYTDLMAYCGPQWISDQNYKNLFAAIPAATMTNKMETAVRDSGPTLFVSGLIDPRAGSAAFLQVRTGNMPAQAPRPSLYLLRLSDAQGSILTEQGLPVIEAEHSPGWLAFDQVITFPQGVRRLELVRKNDGKVLAVQAVSAFAPVIDTVSVNAPITPTLTLSWAASDADGTTPNIDIHYSRDGGATFQPLQLNVTGSSSQIDTTELGGGEGIFRIIATDGVQTARRESAAVTIPFKAPEVRILGAEPGQVFRFGQLVNLSGEVTDPQDEAQPEESLAWRVNGEEAGRGPLLTLQMLPPGTHTITLEVANGAGKKGKAELALTVVDDLEAPTPFLSAAPAEITWQVADGKTEQQTAVVMLSNVGAGDVQWTATSNAPWLTLKPGNGTGNGKVELAADPSTLAGGLIHQATVSIAVKDGEGQTLPALQIPIQLLAGNLHNGPSTNSANKVLLYLPLVQR